MPQSQAGCAQTSYPHVLTIPIFGIMPFGLQLCPANPTYAHLEYQPTLAEEVALLSPSAFNPGNPGSFMLLPQFIRLPFSAPIPVGLVFDPLNITFLPF
jgi:hypothetical protein